MSNKMIDRAFDLIDSDREHSHTLTELRLFAGIAMRSQYKLATQLRAHPNVMELPGGRFQYFRGRPEGGERARLPELERMLNMMMNPRRRR